ncbi:hypothetical protein IAU60_004621 [Kwoniella sp. DSM 27419]
MSWLWGSATNPQFEELAEKACSPLNLPYPQSEDIATALEVADMIRSKAVLPKVAMQSLKRRIASKNGRVQMYALGLTDTCIKNGGDHFLAEIASKEFVDELSGLIKNQTTSPEVKQMLLKQFQQWALAFKSKSELAFFVDIYNELKNSGISFPPPPAQVPSHLLTTTTAPAWVDSDVCMRCRSAFTFTNRKHHCRNCGLVFDQACSSRAMTIPKFGITEEVRVCESCWVKSGKGKTADGPAPAVPGRTPRSRADLDADLQRAIELSLAESQPGGSNFVGSEPPIARKSGHGTAEEDDEELRLAIEASLRDMERARPSAPVGLDEPELRPLPTFDLAPRETETILTFSNTMDQMAAYGERDLRRFPHAHMLAEQAYALGDKLHRNVEEKRTKQEMLAEMQAKLSQAVGLYGQILDGQQAFAARRMQEEQARRYQHQQTMYQQQQYGYGAQGYAPPNGYAQYAPPSESAYQPTQSQAQPAAPSLYPSMPLQAQASYQPQAQGYQYRQDSPAMYAQHQWAPPQANLSRQTSLHVQPTSPPNPNGPQRHASMTYGSRPVYTPDPASQQYPQQPVVNGAPPIPAASHPPPSPTASTRSATLPSAPQRQSSYSHPGLQIQASAPPPASDQGSYQSPTPVQQSLAGSPSQAYNQHGQLQWDGHAHLAEHGSDAPQQHQQPQHHQGYQQPYPQQQQQQQNHQGHHERYEPSQPSAPAPAPAPAGVYSVNSFPSAPGQIFPDAPAELPAKGMEKQEQEEALLIEL